MADVPNGVNVPVFGVNVPKGVVVSFIKETAQVRKEQFPNEKEVRLLLR
jgi:hypothetical protein